MQKKLMLISGVCWVFVFSLFLFEGTIGNTLAAYDLEEMVLVPLQWFVGLAILIAAGIPFGIWIVALSEWQQKLLDESTIFGDKDN